MPSGEERELLAIRKADLPRFVESLAGAFELYGPRPKGNSQAFGRAGTMGDLAPGYGPAVLPPRFLVMPQVEPLFRFGPGADPAPVPLLDSARRVVFGARACDINAVALLDDVMAEGSPDVYYLTRRANTFIVGMDCEAPCYDNSFCRSMGAHRPSGGCDLFLTELGEIYAVQVWSGRASVLTALGEFFPASYSVREQFLEKWSQKDSAFPDRVGYDTSRLPALLAESYENVLWDALAERCFDCGACTVVCPTCYCFDVFDVPELDSSGGVRYRRWDGCQMKSFAAVAGGGNFRGRRADRIRHRLMRKGRYFKEKFGRFACVGCGRCGRACLARIDVLEIFRQLSG